MRILHVTYLGRTWKLTETDLVEWGRTGLLDASIGILLYGWRVA